MSSSLVKLKFADPGKDRDRRETLLYWPASNVPTDARFAVDSSAKANKTSITAESHVHFRSSDATDDTVNYFIATRDPSSGKLICRPTQVYRMFPSYGFKDDLLNETTENSLDDSIRLTKREQLDELKEKFGSRKSQRDLASKRKYEIQFGEDDIDNLPTIKANASDIIMEDVKEADGADSEPKTLSAILPPRNDSAKAVEEVYSLRDIITESEEDAIKEFEETLSGAMKSEYIKGLVAKWADEDEPQIRRMAIYADLLLQLVKLSAYEMRKPDPLPLVEGSIKKLLFERYTSTKQSTGRSLRYVITDQNRDRIFVYVFLLLIFLHRYKPLELEKLQTNCKIPMTNIRRMLELIGCYIENMRNASGVTVKVARFRLPLNVYKEPRKKFRR